MRGSSVVTTSLSGRAASEGFCGLLPGSSRPNFSEAATALIDPLAQTEIYVRARVIILLRALPVVGLRDTAVLVVRVSSSIFGPVSTTSVFKVFLGCDVPPDPLCYCLRVQRVKRSDRKPFVALGQTSGFCGFFCGFIRSGSRSILSSRQVSSFGLSF